MCSLPDVRFDTSDAARFLVAHISFALRTANKLLRPVQDLETQLRRSEYVRSLIANRQRFHDHQHAGSV